MAEDKKHKVKDNQPHQNSLKTEEGIEQKKHS
jgi:hypothetical protein